MTQVRLRAVKIEAVDVDLAAALVATVCGSEASREGDQARIIVDDAALVVEQSLTRSGMSGIEVYSPGASAGSQRVNGVDVVIVDHPAEEPDPAPADVIVDHVAVLVEDLDASARRWENVLGCAAEMIGLHPISGGTMTAARFDLGARMLELVSPVPGTESAIRSRLESAGEGPLALALPARDIEAKRQQLADADVRVVWQDPHWLVHPANPAGLLIQLTPRVRH